MDPIKIIENHYHPESQTFRLLVRHGEQVAEKALAVADRVVHLNPDRTFLREAAMLHDIGIYMTDTPQLGCRGHHPYVCHGILGRMILEPLELNRHAMVCERHVGVGLTVDEIKQHRLPLPLRDMLPVTLEEEIICYADKFFSKDNGGSKTAKSIDEIIAGLKRYGDGGVMRFEAWVERFE